ncbi:MAG: tetratricopeptide repeat protein [Bauldia sp.]
MKQQTPIFSGFAPKQDDAARQALAEAIALVGAGRLDDAMKLLAARGVLKTASGNSLAGDIHLKQGNPREALKAFDAAVRLSPSAPEPYANRGVALLELGRLEEALAAEDRSLRIRPEYAVAHFNRGNILRALRRFDDAVTAYSRALRANPSFVGAYLNRGLAFGALRRPREALEEFTRALRLDPKLAGAHIGRAMSWRDLGDVGEAFVAIDAALAADPTNLQAKHFRCDLLIELDRVEEAMAEIDALLAADPDDVAALAARARALLKLRRLADALEASDALLARDPKNADGYVTRGALLGELGDLEGGLAAIETGRRLGASDKSSLLARAMALATHGKSAEALAEFERALAADPDGALTHYNRAFLRLEMGDWPGGWEEHEWRLKRPDHAHQGFAKLAELWNGEPIAGKRLLVYGEQGFGDTLQFVRYVPRLVETGALVTLMPQAGAVRLLAASFPEIDVIAPVGTRPAFDYQASLMSMPAIFRDTLETLPRQTPYLKAEPERVEKWRARIGEGGLRVGIVWQGSLRYRSDATRSIPLAKFAPLAAVPGVRLFSVQAQIGLEQLDLLGEQLGITRFGEELENNPDGFHEMAAIMANLDLMVMSDTAPTHLAGALGRPVWLALSKRADWRWMRDREDSPWYPTMRLFRQTTAGDWDGVFARIAEALQAEVERRR